MGSGCCVLGICHWLAWESSLLPLTHLFSHLAHALLKIGYGLHICVESKCEWVQRFLKLTNLCIITKPRWRVWWGCKWLCRCLKLLVRVNRSRKLELTLEWCLVIELSRELTLIRSCKLCLRVPLSPRKVGVVFPPRVICLGIRIIPLFLECRI